MRRVTAVAERRDAGTPEREGAGTRGAEKGERPGRQSVSGFRFVDRLRSFYYAARGVSVMLRTQHNAWIHALATGVAVVLGGLLGISREEWFFWPFA